MEIREYKTKRKIANKVDGFLLKKQQSKQKPESVSLRGVYISHACAVVISKPE